MILRGGKQLEGPKGVRNDVNTHKVNDDVVVEKQESSPSNDVNDDVVKDDNEVPKDPKQTSLKSFAPPLLFPQRMAKPKLDYNLGSF